MKLKYIDETRQNRHPGMLSFLAQRVSGLALVFFLFAHLLSLSSLLGGGESFTKMMGSYNTPLFHVAEWFVLVAVLFHMLNGLRLIIADWFGMTRLQRGMFWLAAVATAAICLGSIPFFFIWR